MEKINAFQSFLVQIPKTSLFQCFFPQIFIFIFSKYLMLWTGFKPTSKELHLLQGTLFQDALPAEQLWPRLAVKSLMAN